MQQKKTLIIATLIVVAVAAITVGASYALANQPNHPADCPIGTNGGQSITYGEPTPGSMPGLETRPYNQTTGPDGPQL
jgi:hypothetical protein